jgi:hypothetical protein
MVDKVLCIYVPGDDPDAQLSGQIITAEGTDYLEVDPAFVFSGSFSYVIIQPWWDKTVSIDVGYRYVSKEQFVPITSTIHKTPPIDAPAGTYYLTRASMNQYGLGTLLTVGPFTIVAAGGGAGDSAIPGQAGSLVGTGAGGIFRIDWTLPNTGGLLTLDQFALQYSTNSDHSSPAATIILGKDQHYEFIDPDKTYYFQVAAHNMSGVASDSGTVSLGATGWGPWKTYPVAAASGLFTGAPPPASLPGSVSNFVVNVQNGGAAVGPIFLGSWDVDPDCDDYLLEYCPRSDFSDDHPTNWSISSLISVPIGTSVHSVSGAASTLPASWGASCYFRISGHYPNHITSGGGSGDARQQYWHSDGGWGPWTDFGSLVSADNLPDGILSSTAQSGISRANTGLDSGGVVTQDVPDIKLSSTIRDGAIDAAASAGDAAGSAGDAYGSAVDSADSADFSDTRANNSDGSATASSEHAVDSAGSAVDSSGFADDSSGSAVDSAGSAIDSSGFADDSSGSAANSAGSAVTSGGYASDSNYHAVDSLGYANDSSDSADAAAGYASDAANSASSFSSDISSIDDELSNHLGRIEALEAS